MSYSVWNDASISYACIRLMSKTNYPYNEDLLTPREFIEERNLLEGYIEWKKENQKGSRFSPENLIKFLSLLEGEKQPLLDFWEFMRTQESIRLS
uniref:Uncharacterized protein n=1 Tax=viral metagenome TaxID=1070528 RepID=A0A6C0HRC7_9ZZZZ